MLRLKLTKTITGLRLGSSPGPDEYSVSASVCLLVSFRQANSRHHVIYSVAGSGPLAKSSAYLKFFRSVGATIYYKEISSRNLIRTERVTCTTPDMMAARKILMSYSSSQSNLRLRLQRHIFTRTNALRFWTMGRTFFGPSLGKFGSLID